MRTEKEKKWKYTLCVDFDGVIHSYVSGWKGARKIPDVPVAGALEFLVEAVAYFDVCVYSSRSRELGGKRAMKRWLYSSYAEIAGIKRTGWPSPFNQFEVSEVPKPLPEWYCKVIFSETSMEPWEWEVHYGIKRFLKKIRFPTKKPTTFLTIDDRCWLFDGVFPDPKQLLDFQSWVQRAAAKKE